MLRAQERQVDFAGQLDLATALYQQGEYSEALRAYTQAAQSPDDVLAFVARKGTVRAALHIGEFTLARRAAETLWLEVKTDAEALTLVGDALWAAGRFDEADAEYKRASALDAALPRARFGVARSLASRSRLPEALREIEPAVHASPRDPDLWALLGALLERLNRFDEAATAYTAYADLIPARESVAMATARGRAEFLRSFSGRRPFEVGAADAGQVHTMPFKLVNNKILLQGSLNGVPVEWVLDTGAERTGISPDVAASARIQPVSTTLTAGVGRAAMRRVRLGRADRVEIGSLAVRNVPVAIRSPALGGAPRWQGQSLSPISLGFSVGVDYGRRRLTLAHKLPEAPSDVTLPMRVQRLPLIRGTLNSTHPAYFVVDTGGEVISIGADTADLLGMRPSRHIPLRVLGMSGADEGAFLLPGVDLDFEGVSFRGVGLAVLNLRMPSVLLGFQVGGIVGHKFLSRYRVWIDVPRSEVRLERLVVGG
jgi:Flp pilus assembly protein TadD/predicted aspartyl protease